MRRWAAPRRTPSRPFCMADLSVSGGGHYPPRLIGVRRALAVVLTVALLLLGQAGLAAAAGIAPPDEGEESAPAATQSETTIAVDNSGLNVVVGFNDFRGAASNSLSGYMYSNDG